MDPKHYGCDDDQFNMVWTIAGDPPEYIDLELTTCFQHYRGRGVYEDYSQTHHTSYRIPIKDIAPSMEEAVLWGEGWGDSWNAVNVPFVKAFKEKKK